MFRTKFFPLLFVIALFFAGAVAPAKPVVAKSLVDFQSQWTFQIMPDREGEQGDLAIYALSRSLRSISRIWGPSFGIPYMVETGFDQTNYNGLYLVVYVVYTPDEQKELGTIAGGRTYILYWVGDVLHGG